MYMIMIINDNNLEIENQNYLVKGNGSFQLKNKIV